MKTYAYIRVSSEKQTVENQRNMIQERGYSKNYVASILGVSVTTLYSYVDRCGSESLKRVFYEAPVTIQQPHKAK